jgi:hypothetical protein
MFYGYGHGRSVCILQTREEQRTWTIVCNVEKYFNDAHPTWFNTKS